MRKSRDASLRLITDELLRIVLLLTSLPLVSMCAAKDLPLVLLVPDSGGPKIRLSYFFSSIHIVEAEEGSR
ncbi:hypothetical protein ASPSYDRAFT_52073 [Aspergillus sydowii CBS 593.65]|uniref:Uncharacterized protein n=1 Tax=Aspergillus sydowii CBS 593.65 TaxID=1036612 RepID=A0A1L9SYW6_9EURO|nr:uncharacterized protein ASPSYDRAFT_52073 [Aspergillus sydowii CBS 593.65]OJJ52223.1 hypothetical protein ASPSYDRAFT_52073 [Aspergillus sydowii CBS 593.65]